MCYSTICLTLLPCILQIASLGDETQIKKNRKLGILVGIVGGAMSFSGVNTGFNVEKSNRL